MNIAIGILLTGVAIIHLIPLSGVLSADALSRLYGLSLNEPNLAILMRHRAVLFGLLGGALLITAWMPAYHRVALVLGFISVLSFLWLAYSTGGYNEAIRRVVIADLMALGCLIGALALHLWPGHRA